MFFFHEDKQLRSQSTRKLKVKKKLGGNKATTITNIITEPFQPDNDESEAEFLKLRAELESLRQEINDPDLTDLEDQIKIIEKQNAQQQKDLVRTMSLQRDMISNVFQNEQTRLRSERRYREDM